MKEIALELIIIKSSRESSVLYVVGSTTSAWHHGNLFTQVVVIIIYTVPGSRGWGDVVNYAAMPIVDLIRDIFGLRTQNFRVMAMQFLQKSLRFFILLRSFKYEWIRMPELLAWLRYNLHKNGNGRQRSGRRRGGSRVRAATSTNRV